MQGAHVDQEAFVKDKQAKIKLYTMYIRNTYYICHKYNWNSRHNFRHRFTSLMLSSFLY